MFKKILAITFAIMFLASILSVTSGTITPAFAGNQNSNLPKLGSTIPFGTSNRFGFTSGNFGGGIAADEKNHEVYVGLRNGTMSVIDEKTNAIITNVTTGLGAGTVFVDKNTNRIYTANYGSDTPNGITFYNSSVTVIDGKTNTVIDTIPVGQNILGVGVDDHTHRLYVSNYNNNTISVVDLKTDKVIDTIPSFGEPGGFLINQDTNTVYVVDYWALFANGQVNYNVGALQVIDSKTDKIVGTIYVDNGPEQSGFNENTNRIYVPSFYSNSVDVIDSNTNLIVDNINIPGNGDLTSSALSERLNGLYVTNGFNSTLSVIDLKTDKVIDNIAFGTPTPSCLFAGTCTSIGTYPQNVALDDEAGRLYALGAGDGIMYVFDTNTHHMMEEMDFGHHHHDHDDK